MPLSRSRGSSISSGGYFSGYTEDDFKKIDAAVAKACSQDSRDDIEELVDDDDQSESFDSEIDGLNLEMLTEQELEKLDAFVAEIYFPSHCGSPGTGGGASISIELDDVESSSEHEAARMTKLRSPFRQFRRNGVFSVTDLSQPTWCEVQFDYNLRGKRWRPIEKRPATFKTASGKTISVQQREAKRNDKQTKQGLVVHKKLHLEISPVEVQVDVNTKETRWALRIVNLIACLRDLLHSPRKMTREVPVFGILHDEVVVGVIDELTVYTPHRKRKAKPGTLNDRPSKRSPSNSKSKSNSSDDDAESDVQSDTSLDPAERLSQKSLHTLRLSDAKTVNRFTVPEDGEILKSRLQLYIYLNLLDNLLSLDPPFDFSLLWKKLVVNPDAKLPNKFIMQARPMLDTGAGLQDFGSLSLNDLVALFFDLIVDERFSVSQQLELVYYRRSRKNNKGKEKAQGASEGESEESPSDVEVGTTTVDDEVGSSRMNVDEFPKLGKKVFSYNREEMDTHVSHLLEWWHGKRPPEGVPIHLTGRCGSCPYSNDCEWREAKALELRNSSMGV